MSASGRPPGQGTRTGPRGSHVTLASLDADARNRRASMLVVAGIVALIGVALVAGQLSPAGTGPRASMAALAHASETAGVAPTAAAVGQAAGSQVAGPSLNPLAGLVADEVTGDEVRAALWRGTHEGGVVVADGTLDILPLPCGPPGDAACTDLTAAWLPGVPIQVDRELAPSAWTMVPLSGELVFRVTRGELTYLGLVDGAVSQPVGVLDLLAAEHASPWTVVAVSGWLGPVWPGPDTPDPCPPEDVVRCSGQRWVTDGGASIPVTVDPGVPDPRLLDPAAGPGPVTPGPFLVRQLTSVVCDAPADGSGAACPDDGTSDWHVVAILGPTAVAQLTLR